MSATTDPDALGLDRELAALLRARFHGAVNIRGIRYQLLYSLLRAFELYDSAGPRALRLEGVEDVDLVGLQLGSEYIQVKTADKPWTWGRLGEPVKGFLSALRADPSARFVLVVNFPLHSDVRRLAELGTSSPSSKNELIKRFRMLCRQVGGSTQEADALLRCMKLVSIPEAQVLSQLRMSLLETYNLGTEAADVYLGVLVAHVLTWAQERRTVTKSDLEGVRATVGEALARETEYQAYGRGLIERVGWVPDPVPGDFWDGRGTRPGHIGAALDVPRPLWVGRIEQALQIAGICILRSSSGQGKSTLMYHFAHSAWPAQQTYTLRIAETPEQVAQVRHYLQVRAQLGLPLLLLIDGIGWQTPLWADVAETCVTLGIRVLATVRQEDWQRFGREGVSGYEVLEPVLDLDEARSIYTFVQRASRLHPAVIAPEWAFERIGEPHLLLEYIYLLTHGTMLADRLRDQLRQMAVQHEDPAKVEIIRRVALAHVLGTPVRADALLDSIQLREDPQMVVQTLEGEYLRLEGDALVGLHWVRSEHLAQLLHEGVVKPATTALKTLPAVPAQRLPVFVTQALRSPDMDTEIFLAGLADRVSNNDAPLATTLMVLDGLFAGGEARFFQANRSLFDEAFQQLGSSGPFLLTSKFLPVVPVDSIDRLAELPNEEQAAPFKALQAIAARATLAPRGRDWCRQLLLLVGPHEDARAVESAPSDVGHLLDWAALCSLDLQQWPAWREALLSYLDRLDMPFDDFCVCAQGMYRYRAEAYLEWFERRREDVLGYVQLHSDCLALTVSQETVSIGFLVDPSSGISPNDQAVQRLRRLHSALPFCTNYISEGIWLLPFGLTPSIDETHKHLSGLHASFPSDIEKNGIWTRTVEAEYLPDSFYRYQDAWYAVRRDFLRFLQGLHKGLLKVLVGKFFDFNAVWDEGSAFERLRRALARVPSPPAQLASEVGVGLKSATETWSAFAQNVVVQLLQHLTDRNDERISRLLAHNMHSVADILPRFHGAFDQLFKGVPDYFNARGLNDGEMRTYEQVASLVEPWLLHPPETRPTDVEQFVRAQQRMRQKELQQRLDRTFAPLRAQGQMILAGSDIVREFPVRYLALAFSVDDPCMALPALGKVLDALVAADDIADVYCLVPLLDGAPYLEGGYRISSHQLSEMRANRAPTWEALTPQPIPPHVLRSLSLPPMHKSPRFEFFAHASALVGLAETLLTVQERTTKLQQSPGRFSIELERQQRDHVRELLVQLEAPASRMREQLGKEFAGRAAEDAYQVLHGFLQSLEGSRRRLESGLLPLPPDLNTRAIFSALAQLLRLPLDAQGISTGNPAH